MKRFWNSWSLSLLLATTGLVAEESSLGQNPLAFSRQLVGESLKLQTASQKESLAWEAEQKGLERQIQLLETQERQLQKEVESLNLKQAQKEKEQQELQSWFKTQQQWMEACTETLQKTEQQLKQEATLLPDSLQQKLQDLLSEQGRGSLLERIQRVLKIQAMWAETHRGASWDEEEITWQGKTLTLPVLHLGNVLHFCELEGQTLWRTQTKTWQASEQNIPDWKDLLQSLEGKRPPQMLQLPLARELW